MAVELCPLFSLEKQFQAKNGANNTNGFLKVFLAGTDDPATTYSDYVGTLNPQKIVLDDNGRAVVICDKAKAYRLEVYDADGMLLWTEEPKYCTGNGGGGVSTTRVISTDGSISVDESVVGSQRTYDIGIAPSDSDEFLEWAKCIDEDVPNGVIYPTFVDGTMETEAGKGLHVGKDRFYHITASFRVYPSGTGINYESLTTELKFNNGTSTSLLIRRTYDIDNSLHDSVMCEFSYDFKAPADGYLFFQLNNVTVFHDVAVVMQVHRIYSGINAVPDSCANKQWVRQYYEPISSMSAYIPFSGLEYTEGGQITGISGSAIYAALDSATVSAIASGYAESAVSAISAWSGDFSSISSKIDWSSSGVFAPSGDYAFNSALSSKVDQSAFEQCCEEVHSALDGKLDKSASGEFQPSGQYVYESSYSSFSSEVTNNISSISSFVSGISSDISSKVDQSAFDDCCSAMHSALDDKLDKSASGDFAPSGDYAYNSSLSSYIPTSASGMFQPSGEYQSAGDYAFNSSLSSKLDASASGDFVLNSSFSSYSSDVGDTINNISSSITSIENNITSISSDVSGKVDETAMSAWIPYSSLDYSGTAISGIGGSSLAGMGGGADYSGVAPVNVDNDTRLISVEHRTLCVDETMVAYNSGSSAVIGVNTATFSTEVQHDSNMSGYGTTASPLGLNPLVILSAQGKKGYVYLNGTAGSLTISGDTARFQGTGNNTMNVSFNCKPSAKGAIFIGPWSASNAWAGFSAQYSAGNINAYLRASGSGTAGLTFWDTDGSAQMQKSSIPYWNDKQDASAMTAYQEVSGMTAYQPVGTYIYESALGWAEV